MTERLLHPFAWWLWALALGYAALRTTNILLLAVIIAVSWVVVAARRPDTPWASGYATFLRLGVFVVALRVVLEIAFGQRLPGNVLFTTPQITLPEWVAGTSIGGPVTVAALVGAVAAGLQLAALLACVGAANSLTSPARLLRALPAPFYEVGLVVTVGLSFAPLATVGARRVREARRLRGRPDRGLAAVRGVAVPVLEGALDQALALAASMDSRGYGRRGDLGSTRRRVAAAATLAAVVLTGAGAYALFGGVPALAPVAFLLAAFAFGTSVVIVRTGAPRTRYRPDPWRAAESLTVLVAAIVAVAYTVTARIDPLALVPPLVPASVPPLPVFATGATLLALLPAVVTPIPPPEDSA